MSEFTVTYESCIEAARLASSRGDRLGAEQALTAAIATVGSPGSEALLAAALMKLGELKRDCGSLAESEEMFAQAVDISERVEGDEGVALVAALVNLAGIRAVRGASEDAEQLLTRALSLSEKRLGREHPDLVVLLNDLSRLYLKRSAFALAEPILHRLHAIKRQKGEDHAEVATVLASLASVRQALGDHDAAEQLWRRVLAIRERTLAPNHFAIAMAVENLGETCSARGKVAEALRLFNRALTMREMTLGVAHPSLRTLRERIADLQLQGTDEFSGEDAFSFTAPPVPVRVPPPTVYPTVEIAPPAPAPTVRAAAAEATAAVDVRPQIAAPPVAPTPRPTPMSAPPGEPVKRVATVVTPEPAAEPIVRVVGEQEVRMQALRELAARQAAQKAQAAQAAEAAQAARESAAAAVVEPVPAAVAYTQPKAPELEVPVWAEPRPAAPVAAAVRAAQPMSIILPPPAELDYDDDADDLGPDYALTQTRMQRMSGSLGALFGQRQTQAVAAGALAIALVVVAAALASQPRSEAEDPSAGQALPAQQYVAGGSAALGDSVRSIIADSTPAQTGGSFAAKEANTSPERSRPETSAERTSSKAPAPKPDEPPAAPRVPDLPRSISGIPTAQLDSAMRAAAVPGRVTVAPTVDKPGFETSLGAVDYTERSSKKPPLLIGTIPRIPYPQNLRANGREMGGEVVVEFAVDTLGKPIMSTLRIVRSDHELLAAAVYQVIPSMRFIPATQSGRKVTGNVQLPFAFAVSKDL